MALGDSPDPERKESLVFVYGTLKKGFGNDWLMTDLITAKHARFVGIATTQQPFPLVCGPFQVPFLLNFPSTGHPVHGELYSVDHLGLSRLDELEGVSQGNYQRHPLLVSQLQPDGQTISLTAQAYFAATSYDHRLLNSAPLLLPSYSVKEAAAYVPRRNRPAGVTFLEHVQAWILSHTSSVISG